MRAKVISSTLFQGKIYARERPYSCFVDVSNKIDFSIAISLKGEDCGTLPEVKKEAKKGQLKKEKIFILYYYLLF